jgi:hypothetical protein
MEGYRDVYIGWSVHHEPSDQTDFKNGVNAILGGGVIGYRPDLPRGNR